MAAQATPDLSEFEALARRSTKRPCQIAVVLADLSEQEQEQLHAALARAKEEIPATAIRSWLASRGQDANVQQISGHRRGECLCYVA